MIAEFGRYMCAHALSLSHPGIRCRCLAAYGDAVSAVKWYLFAFLLFNPYRVSNAFVYLTLWVNFSSRQPGLVENTTMIWHNLCWEWAMLPRLFICLEYPRGMPCAYSQLHDWLHDFIILDQALPTASIAKGHISINNVTLTLGGINIIIHTTYVNIRLNVLSFNVVQVGVWSSNEKQWFKESSSMSACHEQQ